MIEIQQETYRYRLTAEPLMAKEPESINDPKKVYEYLMSCVYNGDEIHVREYFYAVFVNKDSRVKGFIKVSEGGVNFCPVDPKIIFPAALKCLATGIVLTHNHPSGNTNPSEIDRRLTKQLSEGARLLSIDLIDHLIVSDCQYYSFRNNGEMCF